MCRSPRTAPNLPGQYRLRRKEPNKIKPTSKTTDPVARVADENNSASPRKGISAGSADGKDRPDLDPVVSTDFNEVAVASSAAGSLITERARSSALLKQQHNPSRT